VSDDDYAHAVNARYTSNYDLEAVILEALRAAGKDVDAIQVEDLAPVDQLHSNGRDATFVMMRKAGVSQGMSVLDVGGGLGGSARVLANETGCAVTVLDLNEQFCRVGEALTARTGLSERVTFRQGNAMELPFEGESFDLVWSQHAAMNIPDKRRMYAEMRRVLRPGGRLALHDVMAGPAQPIHFPVPWAREASICFVLPPEEVRVMVKEVGFREISWEDTSAEVMAWIEQRPAPPPAEPGSPPRLGLHLTVDADFGAIIRNLLRNFQEGRCVVIEAVFERP
jgi:SAM-dependent methyltransferase